MFRSRNKTRQRGDEPVTVSSHYETIKEPKASSKGNWKPSLRKLFSKKDYSKERETRYQQSGYSTLGSDTRDTRDTTAQRSKGPVTMPTERPRYVEIPIPGYEIQKPSEVQKSPHERRDSSKRRSFIQRTLAKKKSKPNLDYQSFLASRDVEESGHLLRQYHDDLVKTAANVPTHAATDLYNCTRQKATDPTRPKSIVRPATAVYVPKQAPDFSAINIRPSTAHGQETRNTQRDVETRETMPETDVPAPIRPVPSRTETDDETADFQEFLRESRITEARNREKRESRRYSVLPTTAQVMDEIMANRQTNELRRELSVSQRTVASKASKRRSIAGSIGEYIKPSRPHTMYGAPSVPSWADASDGKGINGGMYSTTGGESRSRLSRLGGSIRRSMSRDRDRENDERMETARNLRAKQLKRRSLAPPTGNPALNRYNQGVRKKEGNWV